MKKILLVTLVLLFCTSALIIGTDALGQRRDISRGTLARGEATRDESPQVSPNLVISQFQAGGTTANDEFIEIHNNR